MELQNTELMPNGTLRARDKKISWWAIAIAFVFLFNPNVSIIDLLPDFIGYAILSVSLVKLTYVNGALEEAQRAFKKMFIIDVCKIGAIIWVFGLAETTERNSSLLLWAFVYFVLEMIFLVPALIKFFDGMSSLGDFHANTAIHGCGKKGKKSYTEKAKRYSIFFVMAKAFMAFLPELADLSNSSYDETSRFVNIYRYIGVMRLLCFVPILILGIIWAVKIIKYFIRISRDTEFVESVNIAYCKKVFSSNGILAQRNTKLALWLFVIAFLLTLDIRFGGVNCLPDVLSVAFFAAGFVYLCRTVKTTKLYTCLSTVAYGLSAVAQYIVEYYYKNNFSERAMLKNDKAFAFYIAYVALTALQGALLLNLFASLIRATKKTVAAHTGYVLGRGENSSAGENTQIKALQAELCRDLWISFGVCGIYVLSDILYSFYEAIFAFAGRNFGFLGVINIAAGLVFVGFVIRSVLEINEAVRTKYMLE